MDNKQLLSDDKLIQMINEGGQAFELASQHMFDSYYGFYLKLFQKYQLNEESSKDAYTDALVKTIGQIRKGKFKRESKLSTFFYTVLNNSFVDVLRKTTSHKNAPTVELMEYDAKERDLIKMIELKDESNLVISKIDSIGQPCKGILLDWGYYGYSMEEIAERNNLKNTESARSMKYKCLKKLKIQLSNKNIINE